MSEEQLRIDALEYHEFPTPGKISVTPTKALANQRDLALEPTFGGINLEDIKAPECFYIERKLRERMKIPVFHDDQHGTAIVAVAAVLNGLKIVGKDIDKVKMVCSGAGAAALACLNLQVSLGLKRENIFVADSKGVVYKGRKEQMDSDKAVYAQDTAARTLDDIIGGADIFLGLSAGNVLTAEMCKKMARQPIILAMANPSRHDREALARAVLDRRHHHEGRPDRRLRCDGLHHRQVRRRSRCLITSRRTWRPANPRPGPRAEF